MTETIKEETAVVATPQPGFTLNNVTVVANSVELDLEISDEV